MIAHRLSTITHANRIAVIEAAQMTEIGTHDELMRQHGNYQKMVAIQTAGHSVRDQPPATQETTRPDG